MLNVLTKATPTQNIKDLYRYKCGYGRRVLFHKDVLLEDGNYVLWKLSRFRETNERSDSKRWMQINRQTSRDR
jgi:hypothetical protein